MFRFLNLNVPCKAQSLSCCGSKLFEETGTEPFLQKITTCKRSSKTKQKQRNCMGGGAPGPPNGSSSALWVHTHRPPLCGGLPCTLGHGHRYVGSTLYPRVWPPLCGGLPCTLGHGHHYVGVCPVPSGMATAMWGPPCTLGHGHHYVGSTLYPRAWPPLCGGLPCTLGHDRWYLVSHISISKPSSQYLPLCNTHCAQTGSVVKTFSQALYS